MQPDSVPQQLTPTGDQSSINWTASEFIAHQKNAGWYLLLLLGGAVIAAIVYFLTKDVVSTVVVVAVVGVLAVVASRPPRTLSYKLDNYGVHIGQKSFPYANFKSFSVIDEGAISAINLLPLKRFLPPISVYYDPKDEDKIAAIISDYLPFEEHKEDFVDQLVRKIRF